MCLVINFGNQKAISSKPLTCCFFVTSTKRCVYHIKYTPACLHLHMSRHTGQAIKHRGKQRKLEYYCVTEPVKMNEGNIHENQPILHYLQYWACTKTVVSLTIQTSPVIIGYSLTSEHFNSSVQLEVAIVCQYNGIKTDDFFTYICSLSVF